MERGPTASAETGGSVAAGDGRVAAGDGVVEATPWGEDLGAFLKAAIDATRRQATKPSVVRSEREAAERPAAQLPSEEAVRAAALRQPDRALLWAPSGAAGDAAAAEVHRRLAERQPCTVEDLRIAAVVPAFVGSPKAPSKWRLGQSALRACVRAVLRLHADADDLLCASGALNEVAFVDRFDQAHVCVVPSPSADAACAAVLRHPPSAYEGSLRSEVVRDKGPVLRVGECPAASDLVQLRALRRRLGVPDDPRAAARIEALRAQVKAEADELSAARNAAAAADLQAINAQRERLLEVRRGAEAAGGAGSSLTAAQDALFGSAVAVLEHAAREADGRMRESSGVSRAESAAISAATAEREALMMEEVLLLRQRLDAGLADVLLSLVEVGSGVLGARQARDILTAGIGATKRSAAGPRSATSDGAKASTSAAAGAGSGWGPLRSACADAAAAVGVDAVAEGLRLADGVTDDEDAASAAWLLKGRLRQSHIRSAMRDAWRGAPPLPMTAAVLSTDPALARAAEEPGSVFFCDPPTPRAAFKRAMGAASGGKADVSDAALNSFQTAMVSLEAIVTRLISAATLEEFDALAARAKPLGERALAGEDVRKAAAAFAADGPPPPAEAQVQKAVEALGPSGVQAVAADLLHTLQSAAVEEGVRAWQESDANATAPWPPWVDAARWLDARAAAEEVAAVAAERATLDASSDGAAAAPPASDYWAAAMRPLGGVDDTVDTEVDAAVAQTFSGRRPPSSPVKVSELLEEDRLADELVALRLADVNMRFNQEAADLLKLDVRVREDTVAQVLPRVMRLAEGGGGGDLATGLAAQAAGASVRGLARSLRGATDGMLSRLMGTMRSQRYGGVSDDAIARALGRAASRLPSPAS